MIDPTLRPLAVYRAYKAAENGHDFEAMGALLAPDLVVQLNGRSGLSSAGEDVAAMRVLLAAYSDYRREILQIVESGTVAAVRWHVRGMVAPAFAGRLTDLDHHGSSFIEVVEGRIVRAWLYASDGPIQRVLEIAQGDGRG